MPWAEARMGSSGQQKIETIEMKTETRSHSGIVRNEESL